MAEASVTAPATNELLRFSTAGSVDDGKSTLIGRLLYETHAVFDDQLAEAERAGLRQGDDGLNLALLTDGLRAEREQGITIDVAYRYFATPRRRFIVNDTPGHAQYTRNMVTGMSTADAAVILLDASRGVTEQTDRHTLLTALLRVPHLIVCVNKMDLIGYSEGAFRQIEAGLLAYCRRIGREDVTVIPVASLYGDNVVTPSDNMPWYTGPVLLHYLEAVPLPMAQDCVAARFPVQWVQRPQPGARMLYRAYAGRVAGGVLRLEADVIIFPSAVGTRIAALETSDGALAAASSPLSVNLRLEDEIDVARGDLICDAGHPPTVGQTIEATLCWFAQAPLQLGTRYAIKHTTRNARAVITALQYRLDVSTLEQDRGAETLRANDIGRVSLRVTVPLCYDPYEQNRITGSFILIDETTNETVGAGMILL